MTTFAWASDGSDEAVAEVVAGVVGGAGRKIIALPGGATPATIYPRLAQRDLPWDSATLWPTDDRLVPPADEASNFGGLKRAFAATGVHLQPLNVGLAVPRFDLVWIGMGADGHIASLFPGNDPDAAAPRGIIRVAPRPLPPDAPFDRLTLTLAALVNANAIIIVIRGEAKHALLAAAAAGRNDLPVTRLLAAARVPVTAYWQ